MADSLARYASARDEVATLLDELSAALESVDIRRTAERLRSGRFGPYMQLGEGDKPKRASIPKGTDASNVDLELGIKLLSLPREVGKHPETGQPITANFGRFGPYVQHEKQYASLESPEDVFTIGGRGTVVTSRRVIQSGGGTARLTPRQFR